MSEPELTRLRRDLDVMEEAAGLVLPFDWRDVWLALGLVPCGIIILLWAAVGPWESIFASLLPLGLLAIVAAGVQASRRRRLGRNRSQTNDWISSAAVAIAFALLILWEKWLGLPARPVRGAAFIIFGAMCLVLSLSGRQRRVYLAATTTLVPFGIALPFCSPQQVAFVGGVAVVMGGVVAASILAWQLRSERGNRERATD